MSSEFSEAFQGCVYQNLTNLQEAFVKVISNHKMRVLIECQYSQGKSFCYFLKLLSMLQEEKANAGQGIIYLIIGSSKSNIHILVLPNESFIQKTKKNFEVYFDFLRKQFDGCRFLILSEFSANDFEIGTSNILIGSINQVINFFSRDLLNPLEIRSLCLDDLDYALSLGSGSNFHRFISFLKFKDRNIIPNLFIQITVSDDESEDLEKVRKELGVKFTNIRILPEESEGEDEEMAEEMYQMTKEEEEELMKKKNVANLLQEMLHQYYYSNKTENVFAMMYLLFKFKVFPCKTLIITSDINEAYK